MSRQKATLPDALARLKSSKRWDINPSLEGVRELCRLLDDPQDEFVSIQVAGTNGKTSTTRLIAALLRARGQKVGMYTSPELISYNERIELNGAIISDADFARALRTVFACADAHGMELTEFELTTVAAFVAFRAAGVEVAVLEVGLGGRWDATSVVCPRVAVICGIGLDHQAILGDTLEKIAAEKAAIIKPGSVAVLGPLTAVTPAVERLILARARDCGSEARLVRERGAALCADPGPAVTVTRFALLPEGQACPRRLRFTVSSPVFYYDELFYAGPQYQIPNIATALTAIHALADPGQSIRRADNPDASPGTIGLSGATVQQVLDTVRIPGRFERISADLPVYYDGAHNPQAAQVLADTLRSLNMRPTIALGVFADKDYRGVIGALALVARDFIALQPPTERALPASELAEVLAQFRGKPPLATCETWNLERLLEIVEVTEGEPLLVAGSLSLYALLQS